MGVSSDTPPVQGQVEHIDLSPQQRKELVMLLQRHLPNTQVWAFGSRVTLKSQARHASDLDLVVFATRQQQAKVWDFREALEESDLPFSVDVLVWEDIPDHFKPNIKQAYVVIQERH